MSSAQTVAQVLLDSSLPQLDHLFDYAVPQSLESKIRVGQRVRVPLRAGARQAFGYIVALTDSSAFDGTLSELTDLVSEVGMLTPSVYQLARALADRSAGNANDILRLGIPPRQVRIEKEYLKSRAASDGSADFHQEVLAHKPEAQRNPKRVWASCTNHPVRLQTGEWVTGWASDIAARAVHMLHDGLSVIIAVPDRHDLEQLDDAIQALGVQQDLLRIDSQQSNARRYENFLRALEPRPRIVIGNRSVVYSPAHKLGAIIVWDEGDSLFNEPLSPYVHARDAALIRSELESCDLVFVSQIPSLAITRLTKLGYLGQENSSPTQRQIILTAKQSGEAALQRIPKLARDTIAGALTDGPILIQVASPGLVTAVFCADCGQQQRCKTCSGALEPEDAASIRDQKVETLRCRWCAESHARHWCTACNASTFRVSGKGADLTASELQHLFPKTLVRVSDGDNRRTFIDSRPSLVVATRGAEPLAAGGYSAVILLDSERMLAAESLNAEEDVLRYWHNAVSLASAHARVVLTSVLGPVADAFALHREHEWLERQLDERRVLRLPPMVRVARLSGSADAVNNAFASVQDLDTVELVETRSGDEGTISTVIRFHYNAGLEVAKQLRAAVIRDVSISRKPARGTSQAARAKARLRLHFDDATVFDERVQKRRSYATEPRR